MITADDRPLEGFERRLLDELLLEAAALRPVPEPAPARLASAAAPRRRRWRAAAIGGLATAAAFGVLALLPGSERGRLTDGASVPGLGAVAPEPASAAEVRARTVAAMAGYDDAIIHAVQVTTTPDGTYRAEMWFDEAHPERFRSLDYGDDGQPAIDGAMRGGVEGGQRVTRTIDHQRRTWSDTRATPPRASRAAGDEGGLEAPVPLSFAARGVLDAERLTLLERTEVRGRQALVLADDEPGMNRRLVIDAETYLPIRMTASWAPGESYVIDYQWLVRTGETAALLWPDPPAGYERAAVDPTAQQEAKVKAQGGAVEPDGPTP